MTEWELLDNAPVVEALLDIQTTAPEGLQVEALEAIQAGLQERYPEKQARYAWQTGISFSSQSEPSVLESTSKVDGYIFSAGDRGRILQVRRDGFTLSLLRPYPGWAQFAAEARDLWARYAEIARPVATSRIGLRYINHIDLPVPILDFKEYILTVPEVAAELPQGLAEYFMRLVIPDPESRIVGIVTQVLDPRADNEGEGGRVRIVFDIDAFEQVTLPPGDARIWTTVDRLREFKNRVFFGSVTEKLKGALRERARDPR